MAKEKKFGTSMFGFTKNDVNLYVENALSDFERKLKDCENKNQELKKENKDLKFKYEEILTREGKIDQEREKIAQVLIKAQEKAELMLEEAKVEAVAEQNEIQEITEKEKEKLVDIKGEIRTIKNAISNTLKKYEMQLGGIIEEEDDAVIEVEIITEDDTTLRD